MKLNVYVLLPDKNIQTDIFPILDDIEKMKEYLKRRLVNKDKDVSMCIRSTIIDSDEKRIAYGIAIESSLNLDLKAYFTDHPQEFQIVHYLIAPFLGINKISEIPKVIDSIPVIEKKIIENLKAIDDREDAEFESIDSLREFCLNNINNPSLDMKTKALDVSMLGYIFSYLNFQIGKHKEEILEEMVENIKETREEAESVIRNELDILNENIKTVLKDELDDDNPIYKCVYNGEEISESEMIKKLTSHVLPEFLEQININDTLDDEYRIDMKKIIIIRSKGGGIKIARRH